MLRLFANQRRNTVTLLRACLPAVASQNLCNTCNNPRNCRRNMSDNSKAEPPEEKFTSTGHYHIWSLISNRGDSLMALPAPASGKTPEIEFSGSYDDRSVVIDVINSTVLPMPTNSFILTPGGRKRYFLSVTKDVQEFVVVAKPEKDGITDNDRFITHRHGSYSMFESKKYRDMFLGGHKDGSLDLFNVHNLRHPDTRVLLMLHLKQAIKP